MTAHVYFTVDFELGKVVVFQDETGKVHQITFDLCGRFADRPSDSRAALELRRYFSGERMSLDYPVDLSGESAFRTRVYNRVRQIPYGRTVTYGQVAEDAGCPGGARAVGQAMGANRFPLIIPCHRVVSRRGKVGGFSSGVELKKYLLRMEGLSC